MISMISHLPKMHCALLLLLFTINLQKKQSVKVSASELQLLRCFKEYGEKT